MADTDHKRMLEMAAKAFWGNEIDDVVSVEWSEQDNSILYTHADNQDHNGLDRTYRWNPLEEDADAFHLAVALHIGTRSHGPDHWQNANETIAIWDDHEGVPRQLRQEHDGDPRAATRLAITRAAAAIGEKMP